MNRLFQILVLLCLVGAAAWYVVRSLRPPPEDPDARLRVAKVETSDLIREVRIVGTVTPVLLTQIKSEIAGRVTMVHVENGQDVRAGDLLLELDPRELESTREELEREMASTRLRLDKAKRDLERVRGLREKEFSTEQELLDATTEADLRGNELLIQQARLATVEEKLSKTRITAPHDGVVLNLDITAGRVLVGANSFSQGDVPMEIADLTRLRIDAKVNEVDLAVLRLRQKATVTFASIPGLETEAVVSNISPSAEKNNRPQWGQPENVLFPVRLNFTTSDPRVKPGISALARIEAERVPSATVAPVAAIFRDDTGAFAFRRDGTTWSKVQLTLGLAAADEIQILGGLQPGDELALGLPKAFDPRQDDAASPP